MTDTMEISPGLDDSTTFTTEEVATLLGVSYRRVHHLVDRERVPIARVGSGNRMVWPLATVRRLIVAQALADASPTSGSTWPQVVSDVMDGPEVPTDAAFAVWANGTVTYCTTVIEVVGALSDGGGVVALVDI